MYKFGRKISALVLAAVVTVSTVLPAFAAGSPVTGKGDSDTTVSGETLADETVAVTGVTSTTKTATIPSSLDNHKVSVIRTASIKNKFSTVTLILNSDTKVEPMVAKSKKAKKTKKIVIKAADGQRITASQFYKKAFKGFKGKIVVKKSAMTKKQFKKLKKKLRKGGFKGKIVNKK